MAVVTFASASQTPLSIVPSVPRPRRMSAMTRGALFTLGGHVTSLARPVAIAWFARIHGASSLGRFLLIWTCVELGARLATLGFDRGLQRWADDRRAVATVAGMVMAGITALAMALVIALALPRVFGADNAALLPSQLLVIVALPLTAISNVALRAARGSTQITTYVLARGVTEPLLLLAAGLVSSACSDASVALPASLMISVAGGTAVAIAGLVRTFGLPGLATSLVQVRAWPVRELVRTSLPLGLADLLQSAQAKLDLVAVAFATFSATAITAYAIAAEVAGVFVAIRIGFDQIVAPLAAEAGANRIERRRILTTTTRWSSMLAVPIGVAILVSPESLLHWFGGSGDGSVVLLVLAAGRAVEMVLAPFASVLAVVGEPRLSLLAAGAGVAVAVLGQIVVGVLGLGSLAIALASSAGVIASSVLAVYWLVSLETTKR